VTVEKLALRIPEVVEACGIGRTRLYEEIRAGRLEVLHVGRRTIVTAAALREYLDLLRAEQVPHA